MSTFSFFALHLLFASAFAKDGQKNSASLMFHSLFPSSLDSCFSLYWDNYFKACRQREFALRITIFYHAITLSMLSIFYFFTVQLPWLPLYNFVLLTILQQSNANIF